MAISQQSRWDDVGVEPPSGYAKYQGGEQPIAEYDNWFNYAVTQDIANLNRELCGRVLNKTNASSVSLTETDETLKQSIQPDNDFMIPNEIHVVVDNPQGSDCTVYFTIKALLDDDTEYDLLESYETVGEGETFEDYLVNPDLPANSKVKEVRLYAYCSVAPTAGAEPTVWLKRVKGVQN